MVCCHAPGVLALLHRLLPTLPAEVLFALLHQLLVELAELLQEAVVGVDGPLLAHSHQGLQDGHVVEDHQVGYYQHSRTADAHFTADQDFPCEENTADGDGTAIVWLLLLFFLSFDVLDLVCFLCLSYSSMLKSH